MLYPCSWSEVLPQGKGEGKKEGEEGLTLTNEQRYEVERFVAQLEELLENLEKGG